MTPPAVIEQLGGFVLGGDAGRDDGVVVLDSYDGPPIPVEFEDDYAEYCAWTGIDPARSRRRR